VETRDFTLRVQQIAGATKADPSVTTAFTKDDMLIHRVVRGDTLWDVAENCFGEPFRYTELARLSHILDLNTIYPGDIVRIIRKIPANGDADS
jgi:nucleoid-associated protein YgaU